MTRSKYVNRMDCAPQIAVLMTVFAATCLAQNVTEITLPGTRVFPETSVLQPASSTIFGA